MDYFKHFHVNLIRVDLNFSDVFNIMVDAEDRNNEVNIIHIVLVIHFVTSKEIDDHQVVVVEIQIDQVKFATVLYNNFNDVHYVVNQDYK